MLEELRLDGASLGVIDFNKLIPMPESLNIEAGSRTNKGLEFYQKYRYAAPERQAENPELWALGRQAYENLQKYGCATWYDWCPKHWGTKWNACDCVLFGENESALRFLTAWDAVPKLMQMVSEKYPAQKMLYRWADEDIGWNLGEAVLQGGQELKLHIPVGGSKEACKMAEEILSGGLPDMDLLLTPDAPQAVKKPKMDLLGQDGNVFAILGRASRLLKSAGMKAQSEEMFRRVTSCGDYNEALHIISEYVETELSVPAESKKTTKKKGKPAYER